MWEGSYFIVDRIRIGEILKPKDERINKIEGQPDSGAKVLADQDLGDECLHQIYQEQGLGV